MLSTKERIVLIDAADLPLVQPYFWTVSRIRNKFYVQARVDGKPTYLHRFIAAPGSDQLIDHVNGDGLDNRRCNLRPVDYRQNRHSAGKRPGCSSAFKGVVARGDRFTATIKIDGRLKHLGTFMDEREAAMTYDRAALKHFGAFARLNFPLEAGHAA